MKKTFFTLIVLATINLNAKESVETKIIHTNLDSSKLHCGSHPGIPGTFLDERTDITLSTDLLKVDGKKLVSNLYQFEIATTDMSMMNICYGPIEVNGTQTLTTTSVLNEDDQCVQTLSEKLEATINNHLKIARVSAGPIKMKRVVAKEICE